MIRAAGSEVLDFKKALVGELMKTELRHKTSGLEIRVDPAPDFDGFKVGAKRDGAEPIWLTVAYLPLLAGRSSIAQVVDEIVAYVGARERRERSLLPGRML